MLMRVGGLTIWRVGIWGRCWSINWAELACCWLRRRDRIRHQMKPVRLSSPPLIILCHLPANRSHC